MKRTLLFILLLFINIWVFAQNNPIRVGVDNFYPPNVMRAGNNQVFGFDITLMERICKLINRQCVFYPMPFAKLLNMLEKGDIDVALGAITITPDRAARVAFSKPYLDSQARFLGNNSIKPTEFNLNLLKNYNIGVVAGTIFPQVLESLGIQNPKITSFERLDFMIDALNDGEIDIAIMDNANALYWQQQSSGRLIALGKAFKYGYGIGIAINRNENDLLKEVNNALEQYLQGADFKGDYDKFLGYLNTM
ncbi:transporter substrate-binding domain-containing protein [Legionella sp. D16C41]|uniref:transporter substrate-binding domain-containing protein n=1 Tax=Legionella sp. D16C41 TaxID=3402688 RepID=UPI003AF59B08